MIFASLTAIFPILQQKPFSLKVSFRVYLGKTVSVIVLHYLFCRTGFLKVVFFFKCSRFKMVLNDPKQYLATTYWNGITVLQLRVDSRFWIASFKYIDRSFQSFLIDSRSIVYFYHICRQMMYGFPRTLVYMTPLSFNQVNKVIFMKERE